MSEQFEHLISLPGWCDQKRNHGSVLWSSRYRFTEQHICFYSACLCKGLFWRWLKLGAALRGRISEQSQNVKGMSCFFFKQLIRPTSFLHSKNSHQMKHLNKLDVTAVTALFSPLFLILSLLQRMYETSSARPPFITTSLSTGTVTSSGYTSAMRETGSSATQSSHSSYRYVFCMWRRKSQHFQYMSWKKNKCGILGNQLIHFLAVSCSKTLTSFSCVCVCGEYEAAGWPRLTWSLKMKGNVLSDCVHS